MKAVKLAVFMLIALLFATLIHAGCYAETPKDVMTAYYNRYVEAIFKAEGGDKAQYPYGIRSVKCETKAECRKICFNTVRNNYTRWLEANTTQTFLEFLANRYCPTSGKLTEAERRLNVHWKTNVAYFLKEG